MPKMLNMPAQNEVAQHKQHLSIVIQQAVLLVIHVRVECARCDITFAIQQHGIVNIVLCRSLDTTWRAQHTLLNHYHI
jgi:hypothetical protein